MNKSELREELRPEYDLSTLRVRKLGPGRKSFGDVIKLDPDVADAFPTVDAVNEALRFLIRVKEMVDDAHNEDSDYELAEQIPDQQRSPALEAEIKEQNEQYLRTLALYSADLSNREKELLKLHLCGYANDEIAATFGEDVVKIRCDMNAVKAKMRYRARKFGSEENRNNPDPKKATHSRRRM